MGWDSRQWLISRGLIGGGGVQMATPRPLSTQQWRPQKYILLFAPKVGFKSTSSVQVFTAISVFLRPKDGSTVHPGSEWGTETPGPFPTTHCGLCLSLLSVHSAGLSQGPDPATPAPGGSMRGLEPQGRQQAEKHCSVFLSSQLGLRTPNPL